MKNITYRVEYELQLVEHVVDFVFGEVIRRTYNLLRTHKSTDCEVVI